MKENAKFELSFHKLGMALEFVEQGKKMGLLNVEDVMKINLNKLKSHSYFSYSWYAELLEMLKGQGLLGEFQARTIGA